MIVPFNENIYFQFKVYNSKAIPKRMLINLLRFLDFICFPWGSKLCKSLILPSKMCKCVSWIRNFDFIKCYIFFRFWFKFYFGFRFYSDVVIYSYCNWNISRSTQLLNVSLTCDININFDFSILKFFELDSDEMCGIYFQIDFIQLKFVFLSLSRWF